MLPSAPPHRQPYLQIHTHTHTHTHCIALGAPKVTQHFYLKCVMMPRCFFVCGRAPSEGATPEASRVFFCALQCQSWAAACADAFSKATPEASHVFFCALQCRSWAAACADAFNKATPEKAIPCFLLCLAVPKLGGGSVLTLLIKQHLKHHMFLLCLAVPKLGSGVCRRF